MLSIVRALCVPAASQLIKHAAVREASTVAGLRQSAFRDSQKLLLAPFLDIRPMVHPRLEELKMNADFYGKQGLLNSLSAINNSLRVELPERHSIYMGCPGGPSTALQINPLPNKDVVVDPARNGRTPEIVEAPSIANATLRKEAHRMLRIKKRKMKVHRRKRLWKRMWAVWRKKFFRREKRREIEFRQKMIDKVLAAEKFDAKTFVNEYLDDYRFELAPKTYKGARKPQWLIKELMDRDAYLKERKVLNNIDLVTGEELVRKNETVEDFIARTWQKK